MAVKSLVAFQLVVYGEGSSPWPAGHSTSRGVLRPGVRGSVMVPPASLVYEWGAFWPGDGPQPCSPRASPGGWSGEGWRMGGGEHWKIIDTEEERERVRVETHRQAGRKRNTVK